MMLRMSLHYKHYKRCSMILLGFASLLVQGLVNGGAADVGGQSRKPQTVNQSLEVQPNVSAVAIQVKATAPDVQSTAQTNATNQAEAASDTSVVGRANEPDGLAQKQANETHTSEEQASSASPTNVEAATAAATTPTIAASTEASASTENTTDPSPTTQLTTTANATTEATKIAETSTPPTTAPDEPQHSPIVTEKPDQEMSSGIIALVMAIVFAIVVIIVYAGLLLWRRYLEYRYGNRELLVNDLEFDTNDLRHFEL